MTNFEEEYKKRFQDDKSTVKVDTDALWSKVAKQLDAEQVVVANKSKGSVSFILGLLGMFFVIGAFLWLNHIPSSEVSTAMLEKAKKTGDPLVAMSLDEKNNVSNDPELKDKGFDWQSIDSIKELKKDQVSINGNPIKAIDEINSNNGTEKIKNQIASEIYVKDAIELGIKPSAEQGIASSEGKNLANNEPEEVFIGVITGQEIQESKNDKVLSKANSRSIFTENEQIFVDKLEDIERLELIACFFDLKDAQPLIVKENDWGPHEYSKANALLPAEISLMIGAIQLNTTYQSNSDPFSSDLQEKLTKSTKQDWGYSSSLRATWKRNGIYRLGIGLDFDIYRDIYDNVTSQETTVYEEGRIIGLEVDSLGGTHPVYGALQYNATETRTILHHNSYKMLTIPIELGIEKKFNRLSLSIDAGIGYSLFLSQIGRTYNEEGVLVYFNKNDERLPMRSSSISYHIKSQIGYGINERFDLRVEPSVRFLPVQNSPLQGVDRSSMAFSLKFGITYKLK
jgi:hypothetical protein